MRNKSEKKEQENSKRRAKWETDRIKRDQHEHRRNFTGNTSTDPHTEEHEGMVAVASEKCMKKFIPFAISISNTHTQFVSCMIGIHASLLQCRNIRHTLNFCKYTHTTHNSHEDYRRMREKRASLIRGSTKIFTHFPILLHKNIQLTLSKRLF